MVRAWTRNEVLIAVNLYRQLPFGKLHQGNALIIRVAELLGRAPGSVAMKLSNLASLDPDFTASGWVGLPGASTLDRSVWNELTRQPEEIAIESQELMDQLVSTGDVPELSSSSDLSAHTLVALEGELIRMPEKFKPAPEFLDWHYSTCFRR